MRSAAAASDLRRLLEVSLRRPFLSRGPRRVSVLVAGVLAIAAWQATFPGTGTAHFGNYRMVPSSGVTGHEFRFVYYYYYMGLLPVATDRGHQPFLGRPGYDKWTREAAEHVIKHRGHTLQMEWGRTMRVGEPGKIFLYMPYALWKGTPHDPRLQPFHSVMFALALIAVFAAFWWIRLPMLGTLLTILAGSHPLQLYEVHIRENVIGWPITAGLLTLAICMPLLRPAGGAGRSAFLVPAVGGVWIALVTLVRSEPAVLLGSVALACLAAPLAGWGRRFALVAVLLASFLGTRVAWSVWLDGKFAEAERVVATAGGHVFEGQRDEYHLFWHPIWCGLGDFDEKYGHEWRDGAAADYARPILAERYGVTSFEHGIYWADPYETIMRDSVLQHVREDPGWYLGILARRAWRLVTVTPRLQLAGGTHALALPFHGAVSVLLLALFLSRGNTLLSRLALFPLPTSLPAFLIYSGGGMISYSWYHVMGAALAMSVAVPVTIGWMRRRLA